MNSEYPHETATIELHYSGKYENKVINEDEPDSWIEISISVGDTYIYGNSESGVTGFACGAIISFLDSVEAIIENRQYIVEFEYGPTWLALDPLDDDTINVAKSVTLKGAKNPRERLEVDTSRQVKKGAWIDAVLEAARRFYDIVVDLNPELKNREVMEKIRTEIEGVERLSKQRDE